MSDFPQNGNAQTHVPAVSVRLHKKHETQPPVEITRIHVDDGRLTLNVQLSPDAPAYTTPLIAKRACQAAPNLPAHSCINNAGPTFAHVMENTSIPHLLEHLIIDAQVRAMPADDAHRFVGTTHWMREEVPMQAVVEVNFFDDLIALRAAKHALATLNDILST